MFSACKYNVFFLTKKTKNEIRNINVLFNGTFVPL